MEWDSMSNLTHFLGRLSEPLENRIFLLRQNSKLRIIHNIQSTIASLSFAFFDSFSILFFCISFEKYHRFRSNKRAVFQVFSGSLKCHCCYLCFLFHFTVFHPLWSSTHCSLNNFTWLYTPMTGCYCWYFSSFQFQNFYSFVNVFGFPFIFIPDLLFYLIFFNGKVNAHRCPVIPFSFLVLLFR